jgi:hypothetical protein
MKKKGAPRPRLVGEQPQMKENKHVRMFPGVQAYKVLIIYIRVPSTGRCVCVHTYIHVCIYIFYIYNLLGTTSKVHAALLHGIRDVKGLLHH